MARVTVEDCVMVVPNRFELCLVASNRAKNILSGASTKFDRKEKPAVISLREIADQIVDVDNVRNNIINSIKNRGISDYNELLASSSAVSEVIEEIDNQTFALKGNAFIDDNVQVDD